MPDAFGIDYASYQRGEDLAENFGEGFRFVFLKATQGIDYVDPEYVGWARNPGGLIEVPYHYLTRDPWTNQAAFFKSVVGNVPAMMLDMEQGGPVNGAEGLLAVSAFHAPGFLVDLYLPHWYWLQMGSPDLTRWPIRNLIASAYPSTAPGYASALYPGDGYSGWNEYGGRTPDVLQFTDNAIVGGQHVDADAVKDLHVFDVNTPTPAPVPTTPTGWVTSVVNAQVLLNRWPFSPILVEDGIDGPKTRAALNAFQWAAGITADDILGPITYRCLTRWYDPNRVSLRRGDSGTAVKWLQGELNRTIQAHLTLDGVFGPLTESQTKRFQALRHLVVDGVAGHETNAAVQI